MTDNFTRAFCSATGSCVLTCDCGRTHYDCSIPSDFDPGEFDQLEQKHADYPERYFRHFGRFDILDLFGREVVVGCPCRIADTFEQMLNVHRPRVISYYRGLKQQKEKEVEELKIVDEL